MDPLPPEQLASKIELVLSSAARYTRQLNEEQLREVFRNRDRTPGGSAFHIFRVAELAQRQRRSGTRQPVADGSGRHGLACNDPPSQVFSSLRTLSMRGAAYCLVFTALAGDAGATQSATEPVTPAQTANVSFQIVNPDVRTAVRVFLDGKVIFEGLPTPSAFSNIPTISAQVGPVALVAGSRHALIAEVPGGSTRAQEHNSS